MCYTQAFQRLRVLTSFARRNEGTAAGVSLSKPTVCYNTSMEQCRPTAEEYYPGANDMFEVSVSNAAVEAGLCVGNDNTWGKFLRELKRELVEHVECVNGTLRARE